MVKVFIQGETKYLEKAFLVCNFPNYVKAKALKKPVSSVSFGLHIADNIYDRDIVTFITPDGLDCEGVVLRNYRGITSVIECPKYGKRYGLRKVADTVKCIGTALDPNCEDIYRNYKDVYFPIFAANMPVKIGTKKYKNIVTENFMIDLTTSRLITNIRTSDFGFTSNKKIPVNMNPDEYGMQYGEFYEYDVVRFMVNNGTECIGVIKADAFGAYIECEKEKYPLHKTKCKVLGNLLYDKISSFCEVRNGEDAAENKNIFNDSFPAAVSDETAKNKLTYAVYTDGSAASNPGPCGYGYIIANDDNVIRRSSNFLGNGTNNIAELTAIKVALEDAYADAPASISLFSDSKYCIEGIVKWSQSWIRNGYKTSDGKDIANKELWIDLLRIIDKIKETTELSFTWIKGHASNKYNEECDRLAKKAITAFI